MKSGIIVSCQFCGHKCDESELDAHMAECPVAVQNGDYILNLHGWKRAELDNSVEKFSCECCECGVPDEIFIRFHNGDDFEADMFCRGCVDKDIEKNDVHLSVV